MSQYSESQSQGPEDDQDHEQEKDDQPVEIGNIVENALGFLVNERVKTFLDNEWPETDPILHTCTPEKLALAGFYYLSEGNELQACCKCFVCEIEIDLEDFDPHTDPWEFHKERSPSCHFLRVGRHTSGDLRFVDVLSILARKEAQIKVQKYLELEKAAKDIIDSVATDDDPEK